jgi:tRNA A37 methylthiotransferase MiaB
MARDCPEITLRSTFIVGYPGETEAEFQTLLDWMDEAQLDRVGCFKYENVDGARSNACPITCPKRSRKTAGTVSWKRRRRSRRRNCRQGRAEDAGARGHGR